ncbi:MAG: hypothetical protein ACLQVI_37840 [Polyangiaceae bacterium]
MNPDFLDLLRSLLAADVRFMVVGAYAVGVHGRPRATKDLDVWVEPSAENAPRVIRALVEFGAPLMGLTAKDLESPGVGLQFGIAPLRVDVLTKVSGPTFPEAWPNHVDVDFASDVRCPVIGFDSLLANKRAAGRPQDIADVAALEKLRDVSRRS